MNDAENTIEGLDRIVNMLRAVLLLARTRGGRVEPFELDMLRDAIAEYDAAELDDADSILAAVPFVAISNDTTDPDDLALLARLGLLDEETGRPRR